jgi:hypothetical protein
VIWVVKRCRWGLGGQRFIFGSNRKMGRVNLGSDCIALAGDAFICSTKCYSNWLLCVAPKIGVKWQRHSLQAAQDQGSGTAKMLSTF